MELPILDGAQSHIRRYVHCQPDDDIGARSLLLLWTSLGLYP